jgi:nitroreductase
MTRTAVRIGAPIGLFALLAAAAAVTRSLPEPPRRGGKTLLECLWARRSTRRFAPDPLPEGALARILWAADGLNRGDGLRRTAPSAFECYPVAVYAVEKGRAFRYDARDSALVRIAEAAGGEDLRERVAGPGSSFGSAPVVLVLVVDLGAFPERAEPAMREAWAHAECGAKGQNVYLACADLGLGTVFAAVMRPEPLRALLSLPAHRTPAYMMPVGAPAAP